MMLDLKVVKIDQKQSSCFFNQDPYHTLYITCGFITMYRIGFQQTEVFAAINGIITTAGVTYLGKYNKHIAFSRFV
jgi:hypothetical protein